MQLLGSVDAAADQAVAATSVQAAVGVTPAATGTRIAAQTLPQCALEVVSHVGS